MDEGNGALVPKATIYRRVLSKSRWVKVRRATAMKEGKIIAASHVHILTQARRT